MTNRYIFLFLIIFSTFKVFSQQGWVISDDKKKLKAGFKFNENHQKSGEAIFLKYCVSCHGHPGKNDHSNIVPTPKDPASKEYQANSDGELFYKITEGKTPMPSFKNILQTNEIWDVISYIRAFNKSYIQEFSTADSLNASKNKVYSTFIFKQNNKVEITISSDKKENVPIMGKKITLFEKRYFGWLIIDKSKTTDNFGKVNFNYPTDLPGDTVGKVEFKINSENIDGTEETILDTIVITQYKSKPIKILDNRAMWNVRSKAPIWLVALYSGTVIAVFGVIFYIISLLLKIRNSGKNNSL